MADETTPQAPIYDDETRRNLDEYWTARRKEITNQLRRGAIGAVGGAAGRSPQELGAVMPSSRIGGVDPARAEQLILQYNQLRGNTQGSLAQLESALASRDVATIRSALSGITDTFKTLAGSIDVMTRAGAAASSAVTVAQANATGDLAQAVETAIMAAGTNLSRETIQKINTQSRELKEAIAEGATVPETSLNEFINSLMDSSDRPAAAALLFTLVPELDTEIDMRRIDPSTAAKIQELKALGSQHVASNNAKVADMVALGDAFQTMLQEFSSGASLGGYPAMDRVLKDLGLPGLAQYVSPTDMADVALSVRGGLPGTEENPAMKAILGSEGDFKDEIARLRDQADQYGRFKSDVIRERLMSSPQFQAFEEELSTQTGLPQRSQAAWKQYAKGGKQLNRTLSLALRKPSQPELQESMTRAQTALGEAPALPPRDVKFLEKLAEKGSPSTLSAREAGMFNAQMRSVMPATPPVMPATLPVAPGSLIPTADDEELSGSLSDATTTP